MASNMQKQAQNAFKKLLPYINKFKKLAKSNLKVRFLITWSPMLIGVCTGARKLYYGQPGGALLDLTNAASTALDKVIKPTFKDVISFFYDLFFEVIDFLKWMLWAALVLGRIGSLGWDYMGSQNLGQQIARPTGGSKLRIKYQETCITLKKKIGLLITSWLLSLLLKPRNARHITPCNALRCK